MVVVVRFLPPEVAQGWAERSGIRARELKGAHCPKERTICSCWVHTQEKKKSQFGAVAPTPWAAALPLLELAALVALQLFATKVFLGSAANRT
jgi:hypothetical protein